jgi:hypothetical protein
MSRRTTVAGADGRPGWEKLGILDIGEVWNVIDEEIERRCLAEDGQAATSSYAEAPRARGASLLVGEATPGFIAFR